jgi:predicted TIM-barrel fold metal-dependent hydrolase
MSSTTVSHPIVDIHRHIAHPSFMKSLASIPREVFIEQLPAPRQTQNLPPEFIDVDVQVQKQDAVGITKGVLNNPFRLADLKPHMGSVALDIATILNDDLAAIVSQHPDKLDFLATVHPFESGFAEEADRSLTQLHAKGVALTTSYAGRWLDDSALNPFWEYVQARNMTIFLHPPITPTWLPLNDVYPLQEMLYRPFDVMTTVTRMIFSGLFDRYPRLKIVVPFAGSGIMNLLGRLDHTYRSLSIVSSAKNATVCQQQPSTYMGINVYVELGMAFSPTTIQQAIEILGSNHVLFGTDYPAAPLEEQIALVKQLDLSPSKLGQILWKNSNDLFHLEIQ